MKLFTIILIKLIKTYKFLISPLLPQSCRYFPTCSDYSIEALKTYGFFKGIPKSSLKITKLTSYLSPKPVPIAISLRKLLVNKELL